MKIEKQFLEDHQVKLTVEVDPQPFEDAKQRAARKLARRTKIPGFRPGKAPYNIIVRHVGEPAVLEEAIEILVDDIYPKVIEEAEIEPYGPGALEEIANMDPPKFEFLVPLKAEAELGDYKSIRKDYQPKEITDKEINEVIKNLQDRQAISEPVERPVQVSDQAYVHIRATRIPTEAAAEDEAPEDDTLADEAGTEQVAESQPAELIPERTFPVIVESEDAENSDEWPYPGFSYSLVGMSAGDEKEYDYTFPDNTPYSNLQGTQAHFSLKVEDVKARSLPELNDEFAQSVGEYASMDELRKAIQEDLAAHELEHYNSDYDNALLDELIEMSTIKYPPQMLEAEIDNVIERLKDNLAQQSMDIDLYLKARQMDESGLREEARPVAETRLKKSLLLLELSEVEGIHVDPSDVQNETTRTLEQLSSMMAEKDFKKMLQRRDSTTNLVGNIMMDMLIQQTQERLRDIARGITDASAEEPAEEEAQTVSETKAQAEVEAVEAPEAELAAAEEPAAEALVEVSTETDEPQAETATVEEPEE